MNIQRVASGLQLLIVVAALALLLPLVSHAQTSDLQATIRAELLSDPRTSSMTSAQLDAMVNVLSQQAQKQGITATDITWRPQPPVPEGTQTASKASCDGNFTCIFDEAFGFVGPDSGIAFLLGMASMGLVWILAEMIHRRKYPHVFAPPMPPASSGM